MPPHRQPGPTLTYAATGTRRRLIPLVAATLLAAGVGLYPVSHMMPGLLMIERSWLDAAGNRSGTVTFIGT